MALRDEVTALATALESGTAPRTALRRFAEAVDDPAGDLVVAALILASEGSPRHLADLLGRLAAASRDTVTMRLRVETGRARTRSSVRLVTSITVVQNGGSAYVFTRAFLGLTVGCARCHDHKYDPIGTHDYYALAGIFNNANYHEYPIADSARADKFKKDKEFIKKLNDGMGEYMRTESDQLTRVLTLQVSKYMMAAWRVTGREQFPKERAALEARLDLETLERWIDFLNDPPKHYPFLTDWQAMIAAPASGAPIMVAASISPARPLKLMSFIFKCPLLTVR